MNFSEIVGSRFWLEQKKILEIMSILVLNPDAAIFFTDSFVEIHSTTMRYWYRQLLGGICSFMVFWEWHSFFYTNKWIFCWFVAYAFAELIDNALAATAENEGMREIEIRLVWWQTCIFLNSSCNSNVHRVPKKTKQICFYQNFVKFPQISIIFGRKMGNDPNICELYSFSTSTNLRHHLTVLNANVPNCYITPNVVICNELLTT